jgi:hypothetical protein
MDRRKWFIFRSFVGLGLGLGFLIGCGSGVSESGPATGGAGIPGVRGPASSKKPKPRDAKKATARQAPAGRAKPKG